MNANEAYVIRIRGRYYKYHTKKRIQTAWCLAGSTLLREHSLKEVVDELTKRKVRFSVMKVSSEFNCTAKDWDIDFWKMMAKEFEKERNELISKYELQFVGEDLPF